MVRRFRQSTVISNRGSKSRPKRKKQENKILRGKEVSNLESASEGQVIYGKVKTGGVVTFIETSHDAKAYIVSGEESNENALLWTWRVGGASGNNATLKIILSGTNPAISISVVGTVIEITLKSSGGTSQTTTSQLITAVRAHGTLNSLVEIQKMNVNHNNLVQAFPTTAFSFGGGTWLHQIITVACHSTAYIDKLYLDEREVAFGASPDARWGTGIWANKVFMSPHNGWDNEQAQPDLRNQLPARWTDAHRNQGCSFAYLILVWSAALFSEGYPEILFLIRGKQVYDPRTGQTAFQDTFGKEIGRNAALCIADFLNNSKYGFGIPYADIDTTALINAANDCDVLINKNGGGTEPQFQINGTFSTAQDRETTLLQMLQAMDGMIVREGTKWFIYAGIVRAPSVSYTEEHLRGELSVITHLAKDESFNSVRATYINPNANYNETDVPAYIDSSAVAEDGVAIYEDVAFSFVTSSGQCQRLMKIMEKRSRQGIIVVFPATIAALQNRVSDTIYLTIARYGWSNKVFEITDMVFVEEDDGTLGIDMELRETTSGIYSWSDVEETIVDPAPNSNLPSPSDVVEPTNLILTSGTSELYLRVDGTVFSRIKVSWTESITEFVIDGGYYEIQYQLSVNNLNPNTWSIKERISGGNTFTHILDVQDSQRYDVRIRAVSALNYASDWVYSLNHLVIGKTQPPNDVTGFIANISNLGIICKWERSLEVDLRGYRIKRSLTNTWISGTIVENLTTTTQFQDNFRTTGEWYYMIKAVDTSGNESVNHAYFLVTVNLPLPVASLNIKVTNNIILIDWEVPAATSFPVAKYRLYKGDNFAGATLLGEAFVTFQAYTEQFAGTGTFWVTAVDTGDNEGPEVGKRVTWYSPPDTIQYVYNAIDTDDSELSSAIFDEVYPNSFIAPVVVGDSWSQHFSRNGWDKFLDQMVGYDSDTIKAISGLTAWFSGNAEVTVDANNAISQIDDLKNTNHASQGTSANRPYLSRADNKENLNHDSETLSGSSYWFLTRATAANNAAVNRSDGTTTAWSFTESVAASNTHYFNRNGNNSIHPIANGTSIKAIVRVWANGRDRIRLTLSGTAFPAVPASNFYLSGAGSVTTNANGGTGSIVKISTAYGDYYECTLTASATANGGWQRELYLLDSSESTVYTGDGVSGIYGFGIQTIRSTADTTWLITTTHPEFLGINGNRTLVLDGTNDTLSNSLAVNPTGGMYFFTVINVPIVSATKVIASAWSGTAANCRFEIYITAAGAVRVNITKDAYNHYIGRYSNDGAVVAGQTIVLGFTYDGTTNATGIKIYKNGSQIDTTSASAGTYTVPTAGDSLYIGSNNSSPGTYNFVGYLPEVIFGQGATLSAPNQAIIEAYLAKFTTGAYAELEPFIGPEAGFIDEFTARSWSTLQDKIDDGFEVWIEPSDLDTAYFTRIVDTQVIIAGARIEVTFTETLLDGSVDVETYIETSLDLITWTTYAEGTQALASNFRFVKVQLRITGADEMSLVRIGDPAINVGIRKITITGRGTTSAGGTLSVSIGSSFLSLDSIQLTPSGGTGKEVFPVFDYSTLNPTSFDVLGYSAGAPAAVDFTWTVIGATGVL